MKINKKLISLLMSCTMFAAPLSATAVSITPTVANASVKMPSQNTINRQFIEEYHNDLKIWSTKSKLIQHDKQSLKEHASSFHLNSEKLKKFAFTKNVAERKYANESNS